MAQETDSLPELLFSEAAVQAGSRRIRRLADKGALRKLYAGVYTSNLHAPLESIVSRQWLPIVGHLLPGAVISHRSAFDGRPYKGQLFVTRGKTRRIVELPGLRIEVLPGSAAAMDGPSRDMPYGALYLSSEPRRFLENLTRGRGWSSRVLEQSELEAQLEKLLSLRGEHHLNELRDRARELSETLDLAVEFKRLDGIVGALLGTHKGKKLSAHQALARAAGRPYDPARLELFDALFGELNRGVFAPLADPAGTGRARENFAFFEAYFSNYIEGTTFTVEEAEGIVFHGQIIENRTADSHDILGTFQAASRSPWRDQPPENHDEFLSWLKDTNGLVMQKRPDKDPGEWKTKANQAGTTQFVLPGLVPGTLREGFERIRALTDPIARALMTMFVVTEVHPFEDGNGRTARLAMNCVLSAAGFCRIIVPTLYRENYLLPLKALSNNADPKSYLGAMAYIQRWSAAFDYDHSVEELKAALGACNAFQEDTRSFQLLFPEGGLTGAEG